MRELELQQRALLPVELARATNGYIDATEPFKLAKDPAKAARLDTVLHVAARAMHHSLVGLLPILPKAAADCSSWAWKLAARRWPSFTPPPPAPAAGLAKANRCFLKSSHDRQLPGRGCGLFEPVPSSAIAAAWPSVLKPIRQSFVAIQQTACPAAFVRPAPAAADWPPGSG